jgi:UPF0042 nucleotide-binding protein
MELLLQSFGFKYGLPSDTDFIFDVRCLPNPYWVKELRILTGLDVAVQQYLQKQDKVKKMLADITNFIIYWLPCFQTSNKRNNLTVSVGCTGGKHRSVYIIEQIYNNQSKSLLDNILIKHRDL